MTTATLDSKEVLNEIDEVVSQLVDIMASLDGEEVNIIPYQDGWTAGQLFQHITKSTEAITKSMAREGAPAQREPGEHIDKFKKMFLDFTTKFKSREVIAPEEGPYEKMDSIKRLGKSFQELKESAKDKDLAVEIKNTPLGDTTKWELLHFVLYHTQRHLHQMRKIHEALRNRM